MKAICDHKKIQEMVADQDMIPIQASQKQLLDAESLRGVAMVMSWRVDRGLSEL